MADDLDIEAMLEAPYRKEVAKNRSPDSQDDSKRKRRSRSRSHSQGRKRSRSRDRMHSRSQDGKRNRDRKRSRSRDRKYSPSRSHSGSRETHRSKSREPWRTLGWEQGGRYRDHQTDMLLDSLSPEERDARTVFCMQLAARIRPRDLQEFFSAVGEVRLVRMISDRNSRRSKGIAYIEFVEASSVPLAIGLTGQRLLGVPIIVQASQAEKNRAAAAAAAATAAANTVQTGPTRPKRLYVGSLHFNITKEMLRGIFEPFGRLLNIQLMMDSESGCSKGYGFITFANAESAKKALEQLNGFELAGRPMKVGHVTERNEASGGSTFTCDELDLMDMDQGSTSKQLMGPMTEGPGLLPPALQMSGAIAIGALAAVSAAMNPVLNMNMNMNMNMNPPALNLPSQPLATHCFQLSNMFHPSSENTPGWELSIQRDVIEECSKHGGVVHIYVDKNSPEGNVYIKCSSIPAAMASVSALHGRFFRGKMITAAYVPLPTYHNLFPESATATQQLAPPPRQ